MTASIPSIEPARIVAGDSVSWTRSVPDYPATDGWTLRYRLINADQKYDVAAAASGADYLVTVAAAVTAGWAAGDYSWQAYVDGVSSERHTVAEGSITIQPDLAAQAAGYDARTHAQKTLAAIEAWLLNHDAAVASYQIAGRSMAYIPTPELLRLRDKLRAEVRAELAAERVARGLDAGNRLYTRFG